VPKFISLESAAEWLDCSPRTVRRYIAEGRLTAYRIGPRLLRIDVAELEALMRKVPSGGVA
jgi:excisionase family DNA binding protein